MNIKLGLSSQALSCFYRPFSPANEKLNTCKNIYNKFIKSRFFSLKYRCLQRILQKTLDKLFRVLWPCYTSIRPMFPGGPVLDSVNMVIPSWKQYISQKIFKYVLDPIFLKIVLFHLTSVASHKSCLYPWMTILTQLAWIKSIYIYILYLG